MVFINLIRDYNLGDIPLVFKQNPISWTKDWRNWVDVYEAYRNTIPSNSIAQIIESRHQNHNCMAFGEVLTQIALKRKIKSINGIGAAHQQSIHGNCTSHAVSAIVYAEFTAYFVTKFVDNILTERTEHRPHFTASNTCNKLINSSVIHAQLWISTRLLRFGRSLVCIAYKQIRWSTAHHSHNKTNNQNAKHKR